MKVDRLLKTTDTRIGRPSAPRIPGYVQRLAARLPIIGPKNQYAAKRSAEAVTQVEDHFSELIAAREQGRQRCSITSSALQFWPAALQVGVSQSDGVRMADGISGSLSVKAAAGHWYCSV